MSFSLKTAEVQQFGGLEFLAKQAVQGFITGKHKSPLNGYSVEFAEHRQYNTGESIRHIDWKLFAKTDKYFSKKFEEETNLRCHFLLDISASMLYPESETRHNKLEFSVFCIACLIQILKNQRDAFGLSTFSDRIHLHTEAKSSQAHTQYLYGELERLVLQKRVDSESRVAQALDELAEQIHKRSMVVIFSDMLGSGNLEESDALFSALQHLKHRKHEVVMFHVADQATEMEFDFEDRPYEFVDLESKEVIKVQSNEIRGFYVDKINAYVSNLKLKCGQFGIDFFSVDIAQPFDEVLRNYLVKRGKMGG